MKCILNITSKNEKNVELINKINIIMIMIIILAKNIYTYIYI